jgi:uncharacterized protein
MKSIGCSFTFKNEEMILLSSKAVWFPQHLTLLVSDTHLGKGAHFRKAGIPIPKALAQEDLALLSDLIDEFKPQQLIFLGDLFHSDMNNDWAWFSLWREMHKSINMILVKGNHDILPPYFYQELNISVVDDFCLGPFKLVHDFPKVKPQEYIIAGHIHPGVKLTGKAKQQLVVPCFYFGDAYALIPAFGKFTGKAIINYKLNDQVFAIAGNKVLKLSSKGS